MDHQLSRSKCRRKLSPEHALFAEGNALRSSKYYQSMGLSGADGVEEEEEDKPVVFVCRLFNCHGVGFHSLRAYEEHYDLVHRNVCRECFRSFLSLRLLDLHLSETHDAYFRVLAKRQPMYACLVDGCTQVFKHDDKRTKHLVTDHQYPPTFSFHRVRRIPPRPQKTQAHKPTEERKDADAVKIAKAHARKLKRREKKKLEAREKKRSGGSVPMDTSEPRCVEAEEGAPGDEAMEDAGEVGALTERMKQLMVPSSISFGRRRQQRR